MDLSVHHITPFHCIAGVLGRWQGCEGGDYPRVPYHQADRHAHLHDSHEALPRPWDRFRLCAGPWQAAGCGGRRYFVC